MNDGESEWMVIDRNMKRTRTPARQTSAQHSLLTEHDWRRGLHLTHSLITSMATPKTSRDTKRKDVLGGRSAAWRSPAGLTRGTPRGRVERKTPSEPLPVGDEVGIASGGRAARCGGGTDRDGKGDEGDGGEEGREAHLVLLIDESGGTGGREGGEGERARNWEGDARRKKRRGADGAWFIYVRPGCSATRQKRFLERDGGGTRPCTYTDRRVVM